MAEINKIVLKNVKTFLDRLNTAGIHVTKAYLFGSFLSGQQSLLAVEVDIESLAQEFASRIIVAQQNVLEPSEKDYQEIAMGTKFGWIL